MSMGHINGIPGFQTGNIIHAAAPARGIVASVTPGMISAKPDVVCPKRCIYAAQAVNIAEILIIFQLTPRHNIRACGRRVMTGEAVLAVGFNDLAADKTVSMLECIEIVQGLLERPKMLCISGEHHDECGVPHKQAAIERRIDKRRHKPGVLHRTTQIRKRDLPGIVITSQIGIMAIKNRLRQLVAHLVICHRLGHIHLCMKKSILCVIRISLISQFIVL